MEQVPNAIMANFPASTFYLIAGTIVFALIGTITFYLRKWTF